MFTCATQKHKKIHIVQGILISEKTENCIEKYGLRQEKKRFVKNGNKWQIFKEEKEEQF